MYRWFIAYRYLFSRIISFVTLVVVAASVALLIIVVSVMEGFRSELARRVRGSGSDIKVESLHYVGLRNPEALAARLRSVPGVESTAPFVETLVLFRADESLLGPGELEDRYLRVVDVERESRVGDLRQYVEAGAIPIEGWPRDPETLLSRDWIEKGLWKLLDRPSRFESSEAPPPVLLGKESFQRDYIAPGSLVRMTAFSPRTERPITKVFTVAGFFKTGLYELDSKGIIMDWRVADSFMRLVLRDGTPVASGVRVSALPSWRGRRRLAELALTVDEVRREEGVPFVKTQTWREEKASLLRAVQIEKALVSIIVGMIVVFSGFMIFLVLTVQVVEKTRDLGVLQSMGVTPRGIASIYFGLGFTLCLAGTAIGTLYGVGFALSVNTIQRWMKLLLGYEVFPSHIFYMDEIPVRFETFDLLFIIVPTVVASLVASLVPAYRAARKDPVVALRYE